LRAVDWETSATFSMNRSGLSIDIVLPPCPRPSGTDNLLTTPTDFDPFCVTAPVDPRLPGGGGISAAGTASPRRIWHQRQCVDVIEEIREADRGVDESLILALTANAVRHRVPSSTYGRTRPVPAIDSPQALLFCDVTPPFQTPNQSVWPLPVTVGGLKTALLTESSGPQITASWAAPASAITGFRALSGWQPDV
jgi:hypothetical protein